MKTTKQVRVSRALYGAAFLLLASTYVQAQSTTNTPPAAAKADDTEEVILSPFVVSADEDKDRYQATSTLAGTRVRTELADVASSISVVTAQFMKDTGATNNQTLLQYTTNTEVGGVYGNFGGVGATFAEGASEPSLVHPNTNTRIRGLDSADNTRDYFLSDIPWDSFNVGRVDIQRGPNSILFGIGSPAGIINSSVNTAGFENSYVFENRIASYGSLRFSADINQVILDKELSIRIAALDDNAKYRQKPTFNRDKRLYAAVRWDPKLFNSDSSHTSIKVNYERGDVKANRPRILPPGDNITPFWNSSTNKTALDAYYAAVAGIYPRSDTIPLAGENRNYWLDQNAPQGSGIIRITYDGVSTSPSSALVARGGIPSGSGVITQWAIGPTGAQDAQVSGIPYTSGVGIGGYNRFALAMNSINPTQFPGAGSGFYKNYCLTDPTIFDFYNNL
ncbi:MAG: TonB-dependent receptor plug domain-containing protein, partial [Opitutaceae bacterium]